MYIIRLGLIFSLFQCDVALFHHSCVTNKSILRFEKSRRIVPTIPTATVFITKNQLNVDIPLAVVIW